MWETGFNPWVGKLPWRREWLPTAVFLREEFHEHRSLVRYSLWSLKELDMTECLKQSVWVSDWQGVNLWWLILCVNLTRLEGAQIIWSDIVLGVSIGCFWVKLTFEMVDWGKVDCLLYSGWVSSISWGLSRTKRLREQKGRGNFLPAWLRLSWDINFFFFSPAFKCWTETLARPGSQACGNSDWNCIMGSSGSPALLTVDLRIYQLL